MEPNTHHHQYAPDDADRQNRFLSPGNETPNSLNLRDRAASQPPRSQSFVAPPPQAMRINSGGGGSGAFGRFSSGLNTFLEPQSVPTRSASFSLSTHSPVSSMRDSRYDGRIPFEATFEDDESEALSDIQDPYDLYDDRYLRNSMSLRGRTYAADLTRSRSQSLATTRPGAIGSGFPGQGFGQWNGSSPQSIPTRYDIKTPTSGSRYGSLGALGRSPSNGYSQGSITDPSNMSPFVRDVGQILLDEGSAFRELWSGMNPPRDENGGGGSGTTSRRHSVSVVQSRRPIVGFNAPGADMQEESSRTGSLNHASSYSGGLLLTDDDLASDLGVLSLNDRPLTSVQPPSQPSSLPIYAPLSRSPPTSDRMSYQALHLNIPGGMGASFNRQAIVGSPSDSGLSGGSPTHSHMENFVQEGVVGREPARPAQGLMARYVPGHGIQQIPEQGIMPSPISPVGLRSPGHYGQQRRSSDATKPLAELGKGVPLHAVPTSWPLYIVEFKARRTDLFYSTDLALDIRVGDLVIVEADRGKDLGKVINDTITLAEVEAFQKQQKLMSMGHADVHGVPTSPTGASGGVVKDINPKMIYGKARHQDIQSLVPKSEEEAKALALCQSKVKQRKLPMEVVDAEYQWDRRKLTFYFVAEKRIDFRELVRELFRLYKTRIWMASLGGAGGFEPL